MRRTMWQEEAIRERGLKRVDGAEARPRLPGDSFRCAGRGVWYALGTQRNLRIHFMAAATVLVLAAFLGVSTTGLAILALVVGLVIFAEMVNTVIEVLVDLVTTQYHPLAKAAKDVAAGAVLVTAGVAVVIGLLILGPPLWHLIVR